MHQEQLNHAIAKITGETVRTIRQRGFGLVRLNLGRDTQPHYSGMSGPDSLSIPLDCAAVSSRPSKRED